jgi:Tol biopolymer transport system component
MLRFDPRRSGSITTLPALYAVLTLGLSACLVPEEDVPLPEVKTSFPDREVSYDFLYTRWDGGAFGGPVLALGNLEGQSKDLRKLDSGPDSGQVAPSPRGDRVAYLTFDDAAADWDLRVLDIASGADRHLAFVGNGGYPAWSPDGAELAYVAYDEATSQHLVRRIAADGGAATSLGEVNTGSVECIAPQWSPDGTEIAFAAGDRIEVAKVSDGTRRVLIPKGGQDCQPRWSPDGSAIAFARVGGSGELVRVDRAGGAPHSLTPTDGSPLQLRWSPDGQTLAYIDYHHAAASAALYTIPASGGAPRLLTDLDCGIGVDAPAWSPDGSRLLQVRFNFPDATAPLAIIPASGGAPRDTGLIGAGINGANASWLPPAPAAE